MVRWRPHLCKDPYANTVGSAHTPRHNAPTVPTASPLRPPWLAYLLLLLLHYASIQITSLAALTPENEVVVWLPNAVLLAALLHYRGQGGLRFAALAGGSEFISNLSVFDPGTSALLVLANLVEITTAYLLMRHAGASPRLERIRDYGKFLVAGPLVGALIASFIAAAVLKNLPNTATPYLTLVRLWWFGDGLGLLLLTPLLLSFAPTPHPVPTEPLRLGRIDVVLLLLTLALAGAIFSSHGGAIHGVSVTPTLLLPPVLFLAVRCGPRWTAIGVMLISLVTAWGMTTGRQLFGDVDVHLEIVRAQEFILTLCTVGIGFAILLAELKAHERELEDKVRARTHALEASNAQLATLSATDGLTGIANRRRFDEVLASEWSRAARSNQALALVMLDVDFFKPYNDHYGHLAGDDCLRQIASELVTHLRRPGDLVARYGGEEFVLLAPVNDAADAWRMAEGVRQALADLALPHAQSPFGTITASLGLALCVPSKLDASMDALLQQADQALYQAKALGRNKAVAYTEKLSKQ